MPSHPEMPTGANLPQKQWLFDGFNLGNDTFSLPTEVNPKSLVAMLNGELYGKRAVRPRRGGEPLGDSMGSAPVDGLFQFKEGVNNHILGICGGELKRYNINNLTWESVEGGTFTPGLRTRGTKMRGALYMGNGIDDFSRYTDNEVERFSAVPAPSNLVVTTGGTPGTTRYGFQVTTVTAKGESLPTDVFYIDTGADLLTTTNHLKIAFDRVDESQVLGYNIYGRTDTGYGITMMKRVDQPSTGNIEWTDDGSVIPTPWLPPTGDGTDGLKAAMWEQLKGALIAAGVPGQEHAVFFSGTGQRYESFSPAHNGGWVMVRPGDNDRGVSGLAPFENKMIVPKEKSVHQFYFDNQTGDAVLQELITYVGCGAPGSIVVMENDIIFLDSERKLRILGYEPNFQAAIRTTSLSEGRVQSLFNEIDPAYIRNSEGIYHKGRYMLAVTTAGSTVNNQVLVYDRRYLSFLGKWTGKNAHVRSWLTWDGVDGNQRLFAGSSDPDGQVFEVDVEGKLTDWDGSAVQTNLRFRNEDVGNPGQTKIWKWGDFRLYRITGTIKIKTIMDGVLTIDEKSFTSRVRTGWNVVKWNTQRWGTPTGLPASATDLDQTRRKELYNTGQSLQFEVSKSDATSDFIIVSIRGEAFLMPTEVFDSTRYIN